ncbi:acyl carrier protein [Streptomyces tirandamycinicus]|uniref:Acyl carrier protein n=2 Tax=Streptomyces TaxID=1883 RepID=A0A2S1SMB8_9ACTN|nr:MULTISPECIES: acyl carrier protein [Streptomyces]AWI27553.1 acyl carrier protein [Streptomyces tirandamycinicus]MCY0982870.1 acyl carrier protein [Streptomyces tirandamycinicus]NNJ05403.1 acyl carrier protein [Streptomyces sp. PKU-MA01144]TFE50657.1 acyl carrier protein [Streptomyces sp. ICN441]GFH34643.1 acyl carrier protein [Streptomyces pacificus]
MTMQISKLTIEELAALMKKGAGVTVDPAEMGGRPEARFDEYGLDSLGLLGIVGELENRYGRALPQDADRCKTPREFLDLVNNSLMAGA